jgi:beta-galactosidase
MYGWGLRTGDPLFIDYNPWVVGANGEPGFYQRWLSEKYGEIAELNQRYRSGYRDFVEIQPPRAPLASMEELPWFMDWHSCKEEMANHYVEHLYDLLVELGVEVPLTMLSPYLTPYGVRRFADFFQQRGKPILITTQCYPTLFGVGGYSEESSGHIAALMQVSRDWLVGSGHPFISAESQAAMSFHLPPGAMEAFYALQIGQGLAGINFYMMAGGENPAGFGMNTGSSRMM